jgi:phospholipase/carboxylesterase
VRVIAAARSCPRQNAAGSFDTHAPKTQGGPIVIPSAQRRALLAASALVLVALGAIGLAAWRPWAARLTTIVRGGEGPPTVVLLHGYGSSADDWVPFTGTLAVPPGTRFVFPQAPETTVPPDGPIGGRAWWRIELQAHIPPGGRVPDLSATRPPGLAKAAELVRTLLRDLRWQRRGPVVLGGFSQGAMVASEIAFRSRVPLGALVLLSGTTVDEASWETGFASRRGLPVFISHGRRDEILPFEVADRYRRKLEAAGLDVTWVPFDGGHQVPADVVVALNAFLNKLHLK